jgi:hypothetical protein
MRGKVFAGIRGDIYMKRFLGIALMLVLVSAPTFASKRAPTVTLPETVKIGSAQIPAGDYKVTWTGSGSDVQVTLTRDEKAVVTFAAKTVAGKNLPGITTNSEGGVNLLNSIQLDNVSLVLEGATQTGQ